jgi:hypothetical protein
MRHIMRAFPLATAGGLPTNDNLSVRRTALETKVSVVVSKKYDVMQRALSLT